MTGVETVLSVRGLHVTFATTSGPLHAVRGVDLDVAAGELVAVVGESGAGKSSAVLAVMGLHDSTTRVTGSARIPGTELIGARADTLRSMRGRQIAMVFQDPFSALNPVHRVGDQIAEAIRAHRDVAPSAARERVLEALALVGVGDPRARAEQYPHELSGGMRQRAMIAMAIVNEPHVLIADEPTSALDVTVQAQILDVIERIRRELGTAVVLVTHDLGVVARVADRVQVMYAGRIVERGGVAAIFRAPTHPYTQGLLDSLPGRTRGRLSTITGSPPNMLRPPSGCAFRVRCPYVIDACGEQQPALAPVRGSESACIRARDLQLSGVA